MIQTSRSNTVLFALLIVFVRVLLLSAQPPEVVPLLQSGPSENRIDLVFLSEGYRSEEFEAFLRHADYFVNYLFAVQPFEEYRNAFNAYAVSVPSAESGADHPSLGVFKDTYFNSSFDSWGLSRGLTVPPNDFLADSSLGFGKARLLLDQVFPAWDIIVFVVNDASFGGWGDFRGVVTSINILAGDLFVHELGHTLGGLGDEYSTPFPLDPYPVVEEPNTTRETDLEALKWKAWVEEGTPIPTPDDPVFQDRVGLFEGARYRPRGWFRPKKDCLMRSLSVPFCEVCREALVLSVYRRIAPLDGKSPAEERIDAVGDKIVRFNVTSIPWASHLLGYRWRLDGVLLDDQHEAELEVAPVELGNGPHRIEVEVVDPTAFVRVDRERLLHQEVGWDLKITGLSPSDSNRSYFPRLPEEESFFNGVALTNVGADSVDLRVKELGNDDPLKNPACAVELTLPAGQQIARLMRELLDGTSTDSGWIVIEGRRENLGGLYLSGDGETELDGSGPPAFPSRELYFPKIGAIGGVPVSTDILIGNPNDHEIECRLRLWAEGEVEDEKQFSIRANGLLQTGFSDPESSLPGFYEIVVEKGIGAVGWELLRSETDRTRVMLNALTERMRAGYSAQFASQVGSISTRIDLLNPADYPDEVSLEVYNQDGERILGPKVVQLGARSAAQLESEDLLGSGPKDLVTGSLIVTSREGKLLGTSIFCDAGESLRFAAGTPLQEEPLRDALFSQMADSPNIFTGLAVYNANALEAEVQLSVYTSSGELSGEALFPLPGRGRVSKLIPEWVPEARGQIGGYLRIRSSQGVVVQQLFGDRHLKYLASVPPSSPASASGLGNQ